MPRVEVEEIARSRLSNQHIVSDSTRSPEGVLTSLGAIQAQDYPAAFWAIGLRCGDSTTKADVEEAIAKRKISRTWLMRGTLHFAASGDIDWMLMLFAPRLVNTAISRDRNLGLGDDVIKKAEDLFAAALKGKGQLTRDEMYKVLDRGGLNIGGNLGYHMLYRAAWDGVICFGAYVGKQPTFELLHERIASRRELSGPQALGELASRYFTSHGPATVKDFVWWSGLKTSDARAGIEGATPGLVSEGVAGKTFYMEKKILKQSRHESRVHLLPAFDEYLVGYADRSAALGNEDTQRMLRSGKIQLTYSNGIFLPVVVADGEVVGTWKRKAEKKTMAIVIREFMKFDESLVQGVRDAANRYANFLGVQVEISFES